MHLKSHKELIVWQKSIQLVKRIYLLTSKYPKEELYGIVMQMRRASVSVPSNVAEGYGRKSRKEFIQFLKISHGSLLELETQLVISKELKIISDSDFNGAENLLIEILKMLSLMVAKLNAKR